MGETDCHTHKHTHKHTYPLIGKVLQLLKVPLYAVLISDTVVPTACTY